MLSKVLGGASGAAGLAKDRDNNKRAVANIGKNIQGVTLAGPPPGRRLHELERVLHTQTQLTLAEIRVSSPERRLLCAPGSARRAGAARASDHLSEIVEIRRQICIPRGVTSAEGWKGGVEEVKSCELELQLLTLAELEVLPQGQIRIPELGAWDIGHPAGPELSRCRGSEAVWIEVLILCQVRARIAGNQRGQSYIWSTHQRKGTYTGPIEIGGLLVELRPTGNHRDSGDLPVVQGSTNKRVAIVSLGKVKT